MSFMAHMHEIIQLEYKLDHGKKQDERKYEILIEIPCNSYERNQCQEDHEHEGGELHPHIFFVLPASVLVIHAWVT